MKIKTSENNKISLLLCLSSLLGYMITTEIGFFAECPRLALGKGNGRQL
jgi:hypothetical protein